jgi:hypothetical protein
LLRFTMLAAVKNEPPTTAAANQLPLRFNEARGIYD